MKPENMKHDMKAMRVGCGLLMMVSLLSSCNGAPSEETKASIVKKAEAASSLGNHREAYSLILPLAQNGDPDAEFAIGVLTLQGINLEGKTLTQRERDSVSWTWIKKAAVGGNEEAIRHVADGYENGWYGAMKSGELAACWRKAIKQRSEIKQCLALEKKLRLSSNP